MVNVLVRDADADCKQVWHRDESPCVSPLMFHSIVSVPFSGMFAFVSVFAFTITSQTLLIWWLPARSNLTQHLQCAAVSNSSVYKNGSDCISKRWNISSTNCSLQTMETHSSLLLHKSAAGCFASCYVDEVVGTNVRWVLQLHLYPHDCVIGAVAMWKYWCLGKWGSLGHHRFPSVREYL